MPKPPPPPRPDGTYRRPLAVEVNATRTAAPPPPPSSPHEMPPLGADRPPEEVRSSMWAKLGGSNVRMVLAYATLIGVVLKGANDLLATWNGPVRAAQDRALLERVRVLEEKSRQVESYLRSNAQMSHRQHEVLGAAVCKALGGSPHPTFPCGEPTARDPDFRVRWSSEPLDANNRATAVPRMTTEWPLAPWPRFDVASEE